MEAFRGPASGPIPTDPFQYQYWEMAGAHALFVNGLIGIYEVRYVRLLEHILRSTNEEYT